MKFPINIMIAARFRLLVAAAFACGLLACSSGGVSGLTGGGNAVGEIGPITDPGQPNDPAMAAPTQPSGAGSPLAEPPPLTNAMAPNQSSGASSPNVDVGDDKDLSVRLEGSYPVAVANDPQNADPVEVTIQGHVLCAGQPAYGCRNGRILRMFFKRDNQFLEATLVKDPETGEGGYFEFKFSVSKQEIYENAGTQGQNLWQFSIAPSDYGATMLKEKQECPGGWDSCRGPDWTVLFFNWTGPLPAVNKPAHVAPANVAPANVHISL